MRTQPGRDLTVRASQTHVSNVKTYGAAGRQTPWILRSGADARLPLLAAQTTTHWTLAVIRLLDLAVVGSHRGAPCVGAQRSVGSRLVDAVSRSKPGIVSNAARFAKAFALVLLLGVCLTAQEPADDTADAPQAAPRDETEASTPVDTSGSDATGAKVPGNARQGDEGAARAARRAQNAQQSAQQSAQRGKQPAKAERQTPEGLHDEKPGDRKPGQNPERRQPRVDTPEGAPATQPARAKTDASALQKLLGQDSPDATPDSLAFAKLLRQVVAQELHVQDHERQMPLASADPATLSGYKAKRFARIQQDRKFKKKLGRKLPLFALGAPKPGRGQRLSAPDLALLERLKRAHESTRRLSKLNQWESANTDFLKSGDWARRDRAVQLRESLIEQEFVFTRLFDQSEDIAAGTGTKALRNEMIKALDEISPSSRDDSSDYVKLTLTNPDVRTQVLTEVLSVLGTMAPVAPPPPPESELSDKVTFARATLIAQAGLAETVTAFIEAEQKRAELQTKLDTNDKLDPADRHKMTLKRKEIEREMARLKQQWRTTEPDPEKALETIALQRTLIERRMLDIGYRAAAFVRRRDTIEAMEERAREGKANVWGVLEQQQELLQLLASARPDHSPLRGLDAPPSPEQMQAIKSLKAQVQKAVNKAMGKAKAGAGKGKKAPPKKKKKPAGKKKKGKGLFGG